MAEKMNINKLNKYKRDVYDFLDKHRFIDDTKQQPTHLSYGMFQGKFVLDKNERKEFMTKYITALENGVADMSILERPKEYAPIIIDIDLELPIDSLLPDQKRLYDSRMITNVIKCYNDVINKYLEIKENNICIFEKTKPLEKETVLKDGFHIIYPDICLDSKMRHLIRHNVVKECEENKIFENFSNSPDKIIDKAVVSTNSWFLYGCKKPNGQLYSLTKIYNMNNEIIYDNSNSIKDSNYDIKTLVNFFSIQSNRYSKKNITKMKAEFVESEIENQCSNFGIHNTIKAEQIKYEVSASKDDEIRTATKFMSILNEKRADNYSDWINIGLVLHGIDGCLLSTWIEFSKKSNKYKEGECEKVWRNMKKGKTGNILTVKSLAYWAKQDDPKSFEIIKKEELKTWIDNSYVKGDNYTIAKAIYTKYNDRFVCSGIKNNCWWEFKNHRWHRIEEAYTLKILLSEDFTNEYNKSIMDLTVQMSTSNAYNREEIQQKRMRIEKIVENLMSTRYKDTLIKECSSLFYDKDFEQKLDSNPFLIGCENGIYDLENGIFREGRPDDYITLSTHIDYNPWNEKNPYNKQILEFLGKVLTNENVRTYFINALSTCLTGITKDEKFYILTGCGSNGKSLTMDLARHTLGDYYMSCPISMMTNKRGKSNETSPEKVRMKGRRCGVFQETDDGEKLNVGIMKEFTGGDPVLVRDLFKGSQDMIEFKPQMKYFLTCNQLPIVPSVDDGTWRRLRVIDFKSKFINEPTKENEFLIDNTLKQKIELWAPAFLSYIIHIYNTDYKNKNYLVEPPEVMASTNLYKQENDVITEYIMDKITITNNIKDVINQETLWEDFKIWFKNRSDSSNMPKRPELFKLATNMFGEPSKSKCYKRVVFSTLVQSDEQQNSLDV